MTRTTVTVVLVAGLVAAGCKSKPGDVTQEELRKTRTMLGCAKPTAVTRHTCRIVADFASAERITSWPRQGKSARWIGRLSGQRSHWLMYVRLVGAPSGPADVEVADRLTLDQPGQKPVAERFFAAAAGGKAPRLDDLSPVAQKSLKQTWARRLTFARPQVGKPLAATSGKSYGTPACKKSDRADCWLWRRKGERILMLKPSSRVGAAAAELWRAR